MNPWSDLWSLRPGVIYLNHGSFGPSPKVVQEARAAWSARLESEPMDFFVRQLEDHLDHAREDLGRFVGTAGKDLLFIDNATYGMNLIADSFALKPGDEVLATDHEYGAVLRIWRRACERQAANLRVCRLPQPLDSPEAVVDTLFADLTPRTRMIVVSHITSPTAVTLPVQAICRRASQHGIAVCIDGPHAPAAVDLRLDELGCDFYTASCHKWLSAPFGSGFLYVRPRRQQLMRPAVMSWGASLAGKAPSWTDEFFWSGTRDPAPFLAVPAAIEFLTAQGIGTFRDHSRELVRYFRERILSLTGLKPLVPDDPQWTATMLAMPLPASVAEPADVRMHPLQRDLWDQFRIEVPIVNWSGRRWVRLSAHLYNDRSQIDALTDALKRLVFG